jgi:hypothetical protein
MGENEDSAVIMQEDSYLCPNMSASEISWQADEITIAKQYDGDNTPD